VDLDDDGLAHQHVEGQGLDGRSPVDEVVWRVDVGPGVGAHVDLRDVGGVPPGDAMRRLDPDGRVSRPGQHVGADGKG